LNGAAVIGRASGSGSPGTNGSYQEITLANDTFTNAAADTDNLIYTSGAYTAPAICEGSAAMNVIVRIDNSQIFNTTIGPPPGAVGFVDLGPVARIGLGAGTHTVSVRANNHCTGTGQAGSLTIQIDTVALL
jgi:hypothetical protein